jgi:hypothetical protein
MEESPTLDGGQSVVEVPTPDLQQHSLHLIVPAQAPAWTLLTVAMPTRTILREPVPITLVAGIDEFEEVIGQIGFAYAPALPLTSDRIEAIRSNPNATKWVRILVECNKCGNKLKAYAGLERSIDNEAEGWCWYRDLPDRFRCECGTNDINLRYIRESLHALLGSVQKDDGQIEFHRLYERGILEAICDEYWGLLSKKPEEEAIQKFVEKNPVILQSFNPERIFHKAPILSKYQTDFTILDNRGHLVLIEIERANIRLLKKDGSIAADLEHAITQVNDWLHLFDQHRQACLECIGISSADVVQVSGIVIAGRDDTKYAKEHLARLKWRDFGRVTFLTYDDVGRSLVGLLRRFSQL